MMLCFLKKILGDGVAVEPDKGRNLSPVKGTVSVVFPTKPCSGNYDGRRGLISFFISGSIR